MRLSSPDQIRIGLRLFPVRLIRKMQRIALKIHMKKCKKQLSCLLLCFSAGDLQQFFASPLNQLLKRHLP